MKARTCLVAVGLLAITACGLLGKKAAPVDAGPTEVAAPVSAEPSASAAPTVADEVVDAGPVDVKLPGPCVNPKADAAKRSIGGGAVEAENPDLDGDGKKDKIFTQSAQNHSFGWFYVMRGSCGHFVGESGPTDGFHVVGSKSKGLRSFEITASDKCGDCDCKEYTTPLYFSGAKYERGKTKEINKNPCDGGTKPVDAGGAKDAAAAAAKDAGSAKADAFKVGDKLLVEWKGSSYPAVVTAVVAKDQYKIRYDGYGAEWDEVVGPSRIKGRR